MLYKPKLQALDIKHHKPEQAHDSIPIWASYKGEICIVFIGQTSNPASHQHE